MPLSNGTKLAQYEVVEAIGAGGMGEVYRARDTKLGRDVAIKVLPEEFARDKERLDRFEREARLLAQLNHANVATLHGLEEHDGQKFLVMELVEGETLAERIAQGPVPIDETIPLFIQIAEGLEAAHEKGIIHRDLKPANIKIGPDGKPKILDFGLAKAFTGDSSPSPQTESPTVTRHTEAGVILGTAPYMSPEQARGKAVDKRTDVWSFGCCLYEALTGKVAFLGPTVSDTIASILEREPNWETLPHSTPQGIRVALRRTLRKDLLGRLHDIADARIWLEEALSETGEPTSQGGRIRAGSFVAAAFLVATISAAITWTLAGFSADAPNAVTRLVVPLAEDALLARSSIRPAIALSPDGRNLAYVATQGDRRMLYLRPLDELEAQPINGSEGVSTAFFSPDGEWLAFLARGKLMKVSVSGGGAVLVTNTEGAGGEAGFMWGDDGEIIFAPFHNTGLRRVSDQGGEHEVVTTPDREKGYKSHRYPRPLPGGNAVLFTLVTADITSPDDASIALLSLDTGEYRVLIKGGTSAEYSPSGHLVYARKGALFAVPFDAEALQVNGTPVPVLEGVAMSTTGGSAEFSLSREGSLLYAPGKQWGADRRVIWVDRHGRAEPLIDTPGQWLTPAISPDGSRLLVRNLLTNSSLWIFDMERATLTRVVHGWDNGFPSWSPDGRRFTFASSRAGGQYDLHVQAADGSREPEPLTRGEHMHGFSDWSPDGGVLLFDDYQVGTGLDLWWLAIETDATPELFLQTEFNETLPTFSPNGRWVAYASDETGRFEVYIRPFPPGSGMMQVSAEGGDSPVWHPNGKEIFYRNGDALLAVWVETEGQELVLGKSRHLFDKRTAAQFDVAPDGRRFIMVEEPAVNSAPAQLVLVQNFDEELKQLVPTN